MVVSGDGLISGVRSEGGDVYVGRAFMTRVILEGYLGIQEVEAYVTMPAFFKLCLPASWRCA